MAIGKIGNLPFHLRDELNSRLNDGEPGNELVDWLNADPEVVEVMNERFDGRAISEQNLSEWKKFGYQQWLTLRTILAESESLSESAGLLQETGINSERLLLILTARYAEMIQRWNLTPTDQLNYKMGVFRQFTDTVLALRRAELQTIRLEIARERLQLLRERQRDTSTSSSATAPSSSPDAASGISASPPIPTQPSSPQSHPTIPAAPENHRREPSCNISEPILGCRGSTEADHPLASPPISTPLFDPDESAQHRPLAHLPASPAPLAEPEPTPPFVPTAVPSSQVGGPPSNKTSRNPRGLL